MQQSRQECVRVASASRTAAGAGVAVQPVQRIVVDDDDAGQRLDAFLARRFPHLPKSCLYRWIRSGQLRVNGARGAIDYRLQVADQLRIPPIFGDPAQPAGHGSASGARRGLSDPVRQERAQLARRLGILHEDADLIALDKPASVAVHGGSGIASGVIEQLRAARPQARFLELVHRLDRETSGVLLVACRRTALVHLHAQFRARTADKRYRALVLGHWPLRTRKLAFPLHRLEAPDGDRRVIVRADGQEAVTYVTGLANLDLPGAGPCALIEARPETGRTHQIRVHLAQAGHPIIGDPKYGDFALNRQCTRAGLRRMYLHAHSLTFHHPRTGERMRIEAPLPDDFLRFLPAGHTALPAGSRAVR